MRFIAVLLALIFFGLGTFIGFRLGFNSRARTEISVSIPMLVKVHKSIQSGDQRETMALTEMMLLSKLNRYNLLKESLTAKMLYGTNLVNSPLFVKYLNEAKVIKEIASTNLIFIDNSATNRTSEFESDMPTKAPVVPNANEN